MKRAVRRIVAVAKQARGRLRVVLALGALVIFPSPASLAMADGPTKITYDDQVRPIFREHCLSCHNQDAKKGDLALDSYAGMLRGGSTGEVIAAGNPDGSRLWA